ncbi:MAG: bifunctional DNA-formamidopyrimidine glycosylase/DNA-(apurinic or apyrimidinic site) lyase [Bauldia sp.]|uniref:bifunctional DNA-formamidopyrimidine glycosylase/DNA-(apurinic or apyrimidinic site) lyase n=1 Tax=Bauldia sp. TaxID=2575872 RepID=UPI001D4F235F|nr:bifunctional DNA-formamidopyrimidine glycosylase/DNA-(apurinic or apyrimidinic site) lyase [Bauldia sp.]MCB1496468.1 bifunctional DNA-formamidopyrimidine glycosylase/DNA-(apurinic or apyrimidinic site) lyase [Bauldia sp.]
MPELPEVETVRLGLRPVMEGAVIDKASVRRPDLRRPFPPRFARRLAGRRITHLGRRAKYLLAELDDGNVLVMHLGMSGSFRIEAEAKDTLPATTHHPRGKLAAHDHVVFDLSSGARVIFNDPRRFGLMDLIPRADLARSPLFARMGIEPLGNEMGGALIAGLFKGRAAPLKAMLLDQTRIAGLGNIYVCEALWRARLSPSRPAGSIATGRKTAANRADALAAAIRDVLGEAIAAGGSSLRDHRQANGDLGYFQHRFAVYDREGEPCPRHDCSGIVRRMVQSGRSTFYCPVCQK